jgi:hypothetical protein
MRAAETLGVLKTDEFDSWVLALTDRRTIASIISRIERPGMGNAEDVSWGAWLTLRGCAEWAHDHNPVRAATALFEPLPDASFVVNGARGDPDAAPVSAGGEMKRLGGSRWRRPSRVNSPAIPRAPASSWHRHVVSWAAVGA